MFCKLINLQISIIYLLNNVDNFIKLLKKLINRYNTNIKDTKKIF